MTNSSKKNIQLSKSASEQKREMGKDPAQKIANFWNSYQKQGLNLSRDSQRFVQHYENCCDKIKEDRKNLNRWSGEEAVKPGHIRFVVISDTHQRDIVSNIPDGDVLLHCGDFTMYSQEKEFRKFNEWVGTLPHPKKIVIAGNHERLLEESRIVSLLGLVGATPREELRGLLTNCTYIENQSIRVHGYNIYGSPVTPRHMGGFQANRGSECANNWKAIPDDTDILLTHGPPVGVGDLTKRNDNAGCVDLLREVQTRVRPRYHCFGHIHEGNGVYSDGVTTYINAALCDVTYKAKQSAYVFDLPRLDYTVETQGDTATEENVEQVIMDEDVLNGTGDIAENMESLSLNRGPGPSNNEPGTS